MLISLTSKRGSDNVIDEGWIFYNKHTVLINKIDDLMNSTSLIKYKVRKLLIQLVIFVCQTYMFC